MWGLGGYALNVPMDVHILTKEWDQMRGDWDMYMGPHSDTHFHAVIQRGGADMGKNNGVGRGTGTDASMRLLLQILV